MHYESRVVSNYWYFLFSPQLMQQMGGAGMGGGRTGNNLANLDVSLWVVSNRREGDALEVD